MGSNLDLERIDFTPGSGLGSGSVLDRLLVIASQSTANVEALVDEFQNLIGSGVTLDKASFT